LQPLCGGLVVQQVRQLDAALRERRPAGPAQLELADAIKVLVERVDRDAASVAPVGAERLQLRRDRVAPAPHLKDEVRVLRARERRLDARRKVAVARHQHHDLARLFALVHHVEFGLANVRSIVDAERAGRRLRDGRRLCDEAVDALEHLVVHANVDHLLLAARRSLINVHRERRWQGSLGELRGLGGRAVLGLEDGHLVVLALGAEQLRLLENLQQGSLHEAPARVLATALDVGAGAQRVRELLAFDPNVRMVEKDMQALGDGALDARVALATQDLEQRDRVAAVVDQVIAVARAQTPEHALCLETEQALGHRVDRLAMQRSIRAPLRQQLLHARSVALGPRRLVDEVQTPRVGAVLAQRVPHVEAGGLAGRVIVDEMQRRVAAVGRGVEVGLVLEQQLHHGLVAMRCGPVQRRDLELVGGVGVDVRQREQHLHRGQIVLLGREQQGVHAVVASLRRVDAVSHERAGDARETIDIAASVRQRVHRSGANVRGRDHEARGEQRIDLVWVAALDGFVELRVAVLIHG